MGQTHGIVFLFDVDDTLFDNDRLKADLREKVLKDFGQDACQRFWAIYEEQRAKRGYADFLGTLERFRIEHMGEPRVLALANWVMDYPYSERLYSDALAVVRHVRQWGLPVILTDGDGVYQPYKLERAGLIDAFDGHVLDYIHKEKELDAVARAYPAGQYVVIDDKLRVLDAIKKVWRDRVTTIFVKQGHYARDAKATADCLPADVTLERIASLMTYEFSAFAPV